MARQNRGALPAATHDLAEFGQIGTGGGGTPYTDLAPGVGSFNWIQQPTVTASSNNYPTGMLLLTPIYLPAGTYDAVSFVVATAGSTGAKARVVGYTVDATTSQPSALLFDTGQVDTSTTGAKIVTGLAITGGQVIWAGAVNQASPTTDARLTTVSSSAIPLILNSAPTATLTGTNIYQVNGITAAPPSTMSGGNRIVDQSYALSFRRSA